MAVCRHVDNAGVPERGTRRYKMSNRERLVQIVAAQAHEVWREHWRREHGDAPRSKQTRDRAWIAAHGTDHVDIAAASFGELPADWQEENQRNAEVSVDGVIASVTAGLPLDTARIESLAAMVHAAWLTRNGSWAPPHQRRPYAELDESDKERDRIVVSWTIAAMKAEDR